MPLQFQPTTTCFDIILASYMRIVCVYVVLDQNYPPISYGMGNIHIEAWVCVSIGLKCNEMKWNGILCGYICARQESTCFFILSFKIKGAHNEMHQQKKKQRRQLMHEKITVWRWGILRCMFARARVFFFPSFPLSLSRTHAHAQCTSGHEHLIIAFCFIRALAIKLLVKCVPKHIQTN